MASIILLSVCVLLVLYKIYKYMFHRPPNFPPGPPRLPLVGSYLFMLMINYSHLHRAVDILCKWYSSNIIGLYFADVPTIIVNDPPGVKEALNNRDFDGRPALLLAKLRCPDFNIRGIFFTQGPLWQTQRRFTLRHLRDFGFGRRLIDLEMDMRDEIEILLDMIKNGPKFEHEKEYVQDGKILCPQIFFACFANCFLQTLVNERLPRKDFHRTFTAGKFALKFQRNADDFGRMFSIVPWVADYFPNISGYNVIKEGSDGLFAFMKSVVDEHIATYNENHVRSFLDIYIKEMKEAEKLDDKNSTFFYNQLILIGVDFLLPSLTGLSSTVAMLIQRLFTVPEVITKMQHEIDEIVGRGRLPELDDRVYMPYTEATIREGMRMETLLPSGIPHCALNDTQIMGYDIPKGSFLVTGLQGSHLDKTRWSDSDKFRPERYLDYTGKLSLKKDYSLPFGAGKRLCAGETFARNALFLMVSALYQNFNFVVADGHPIPKMSELITGVIITPPDFWVKPVPR